MLVRLTGNSKLSIDVSVSASGYLSLLVQSLWVGMDGERFPLKKKSFNQCVEMQHMEKQAFAFPLMRAALILSVFASRTRFFVTCVVLLLGYIRATPPPSASSPHHHTTTTPPPLPPPPPPPSHLPADLR